MVDRSMVAAVFSSSGSAADIGIGLGFFDFLGFGLGPFGCSGFSPYKCSSFSP